ncbi:iron-siderophore ABC transporter iron-siderophore-binging protein [Bacillus sp. TS-2]|nr:iron-siderophore ABC transporter iron-siderophore-binging protein [Bacillus sp. TS-2]
MYEKEEKELAKAKESLDHIQVPTKKLDAAILTGFQRAKTETKENSIDTPKKAVRKIRRWLIPSLAAAILMLSLVSSIRVSTAFAHYVAEIPGMEKIVELIRFDKGLISAVESDYLQEIGETQEKKGLSVTVDSVIVDETGMVLFYTIEANKKQSQFYVEDFELTPADGTDLEIGSISSQYDFLDAEKLHKSFSSSAELFFLEELETKTFNLIMKVETDDHKETFDFVFSLEKPVKVKKTYELEETISIGEQEIKVKNITVSPLRVAVHVEYAPDNSKKIFEFPDIRLVDEYGESWTKIANGVSASQISENEAIIYLQSNYFKEPEELFLVINKIQAVDKDEAYLIVDTEKEEILKQPKGTALSNVEWEDEMLMITLDVSEEFNYFFLNEVRDADGQEFYENLSYSLREENGIQKMGISLPKTNEIPYKNPLRMELSYFPSWIEGDVKLRVK